MYIFPKFVQTPLPDGSLIPEIPVVYSLLFVSSDNEQEPDLDEFIKIFN